MTKWGVRLVGFYFLIWAALNLIGLIQSPSQTKGFLGITSYVTYEVSFLHKVGSIEIMGWIGIGVLVIAGYNLLWIQSSGRIIALIILWWTTISSGIYIILILLATIIGFFSSKGTASATITFFQWSREVNDPLILTLACAGVFLFYAIPTHFLMRKDVKQLFQKPSTTGETH